VLLASILWLGSWRRLPFVYSFRSFAARLRPSRLGSAFLSVKFKWQSRRINGSIAGVTTPRAE
jgi:hypothetical protein